MLRVIIGVLFAAPAWACNMVVLVESGDEVVGVGEVPCEVQILNRDRTKTVLEKWNARIPKTEAAARAWIQTHQEQFEAELRFAYEPVFVAALYRIAECPAVIVDNEHVYKGSTDLEVVYETHYGVAP